MQVTICLYCININSRDWDFVEISRKNPNDRRAVMQTEQSTNLPSMSYEEKISRRDFKQTRILSFLADYEVFTTVKVVGLLLEVSQSSARRALEQLVTARMLISEDHYINGHSIKIFGISQSALIAIEAEEGAPFFERGKAKSNYIRHKLEIQRVRIVAEKMGATFQAERKIRINQKGLKKIPDAIMNLKVADIRVPGYRICIECELEPKTAKRLTAVNENYLNMFETEEVVDSVLYLYPNKFLNGAMRLMKSLPQPACTNRPNLSALRQFRYLYGALETFPSGIKFADGSAVDFTTQIFPDTFE